MTISTITRIMRRGSGTSDDSLIVAALGIAEWLRLAAAPSYAIMAFVTAVFGASPKDMLCMAMHYSSPLSGMVGSMAWMYVLMSVFHSAPWLKLMASWATTGRQA
jgi:hypothetical protein